MTPGARSVEVESSPDEGRDQDVTRGLVVEWFRLERGRQLWRILAVGAPLVLLGDVCAGVALSFDQLGGTWQTVILIAGIGATAAGPGYVIWKLRHLWGEDRFVALRTHGVQYAGADDTWFESWDAIDDVELDDTDNVRLLLEGGITKTLSGPFAGAGPADLAEKLRTVRRKALFGLYKT